MKICVSMFKILKNLLKIPYQTGSKYLLTFSKLKTKNKNSTVFKLV